MRCLTLADALRTHGAEVQFISRKLEGNLIDFIESKGFRVFHLDKGSFQLEKEISSPPHAHWLLASQSEDAQSCENILRGITPDWLIVDHYALDVQWENKLKKICKRLMVIDDLADRNHNCDLLLDQTLGRTFTDYEPFVPDTSSMLGAQYALLRPEFAEWREYSLKRREEFQLKNILVSLGGADPDNYTAQVLEVLSGCSLPEAIKVTVVLGATYPYLESIKKLSEQMPYSVEIAMNISNMAEVMSNSDIAIGAAGSTAWERCCLGLPTVQIVTADNQKMIARTLSDHGAAVSINNLQELPEAIKTVERSMMNISANATNVTDGSGVFRVLDKLCSLSKT